MEETNYSYGAPGSEGPRKNPGMAIAALVLGIVSLVLCCCYYISIPCGILAIVFAILVLRKGPDGKGMAIAGIICGAVSIVLALVLLFAAGAMMAAMPELQQLVDQYGYYDY